MERQMILREHLTPNQASLLVEQHTDTETSKKKLFMSGVFIQGGVKNLNERVYPIDEIKNAVNNVNGQIRENYTICGEIDHPEELNINIDRISHRINQMWMDGPNGLCKLEILPTPMGEIARTLLEAGVKLGVSSRGSGNVDDKGHVSEFEIVTVDLVMKPSAPDAYPKMMYEALYGRRGRVVEDLAKAVINDPKAKKYLVKELLESIYNLKIKV